MINRYIAHWLSSPISEEVRGETGCETNQAKLFGMLRVCQEK